MFAKLSVHHRSKEKIKKLKSTKSLCISITAQLPLVSARTLLQQTVQWSEVTAVHLHTQTRQQQKQ